MTCFILSGFTNFCLSHTLYLILKWQYKSFSIFGYNYIIRDGEKRTILGTVWLYQVKFVTILLLILNCFDFSVSRPLNLFSEGIKFALLFDLNVSYVPLPLFFANFSFVSRHIYTTLTVFRISCPQLFNRIIVSKIWQIYRETFEP